MSSKNSQLSALIETALVTAFGYGFILYSDFASWFTPSFGAVPVVLFAYVAVKVRNSSWSYLGLASLYFR